MKYLLFYQDKIYLFNKDNKLCLFSQLPVKIIIKSRGTICRLQDGNQCTALKLKELPSTGVYPYSTDCKLSQDAFYAVMAFRLKTQLAIYADAVGGDWLKLLGLIEPILQGEYYA